MLLALRSQWELPSATQTQGAAVPPRHVIEQWRIEREEEEEAIATIIALEF